MSISSLVFCVLMLPGSRARGGEVHDYAYFYENVMGTSLEIRVKAVSEPARRRRRVRRLGRDRSNERGVQRI